MKWNVVFALVHLVFVQMTAGVRVRISDTKLLGLPITFRGSPICPMIRIQNGRVRMRGKSFAQYSCNKGYILAGERFLKCTQTAKWDSDPPICVRPDCQQVQKIENGIVHPSHRGGVLNFYCVANFLLQGQSEVFCVNRKWNAPMPTCLPSNTKSSLSCDFETDGICGWTHDLNHNFDWRRMNNRTPSGHLATGPSSDHTKGPGGNGFYMYIEASGRNMNDTARLISPIYTKESNNTCLEFYYHMYGSGIGQLRVYVKKIDEPWYFKDEDVIFLKDGNQGNEWLKGLVELGAINNQFQVVFEGVRGFSYISDIAIDDVTIIENCISDYSTTTEQEISASTFVYESCSNKCNITTEYDWMCSCAEDCFEKNACCPDYIAICVFGNDTDITDSIGLEDFSDETTYDMPISFTMPGTTTVLPTSKLPNIWITFTTKSNIYTSSTTQRTITKLSTTKMTTKTVSPTEPITEKPTSPTVTENPRKTTITRYFLNDMLTIPTETTTEDNYIFIEDENEVFTKEYLASDDDFHPILSDKVAPVHELPRPSNRITMIAVFTVCFLAVGVLAVVFMAKRYTSKNCMGVRRMRRGNGDSQSDVRFLTSDEVLDFNIATPVVG